MFYAEKNPSKVTDSILAGKPFNAPSRWPESDSFDASSTCMFNEEMVPVIRNGNGRIDIQSVVPRQKIDVNSSSRVDYDRHVPASPASATRSTVTFQRENRPRRCFQLSQHFAISNTSHCTTGHPYGSLTPSSPGGGANCVQFRPSGHGSSGHLPGSHRRDGNPSTRPCHPNPIGRPTGMTISGSRHRSPAIRHCPNLVEKIVVAFAQLRLGLASQCSNDQRYSIAVTDDQHLLTASVAQSGCRPV